MIGYIKLHREIQNHWLYTEKRVFSRYEAWLDILMRVNHKPQKISHNGKPELIERGSTVWSMGDMEQRWGWSNRKVKRFLDCLVDDQMLDVKSTTKKTYLTVVNYGKYQGSDEENAPQTHQGSISKAYQKHTNKNVKNVKKEKKEESMSSGSSDPGPSLPEIIVSYLNERASKKFSYKTTATVKAINGRLNEGRKLDDFKRVIDVKVAEWLHDEKMNQYLCPDTLFRPSNFEKYLNQPMPKANQFDSESYLAGLEDK